MATTVIVFDKVTNNTKTISVDVKASILEGDSDVDVGRMNYFLVLNTNSKSVNGNAIAEHVISSKSDLARGTTQQDGGTSSDYITLTAAVQDHIWNLVSGTGGGTEMKFTS